MHEDHRRMVRGLASLIGTIIGAGIFAVPYVISRVGMIVGIGYVVVIGVAMTLLHWYFGVVALAVPGHHRFPGFAEHFFGRVGKHIAGVLGLLGGWFLLAAQIILAGTFLSFLFGPAHAAGAVLWSVIFTVMGALIVMRGIIGTAKTEVIITAALLVVLLVIIAAAVPHLAIEHLATFNRRDLFLPYGVLMFAMTGLAVIPELEDLVGLGARVRLRRVVVWGTVIAAVMVGLFGVVVAGVTGAGTTPEAITGLARVLGPWVLVVGALVGFLAIITSYLPVLLNQTDMFHYDYHVPRTVGWLLAWGVPLLIFLAGARDVIRVMGFVGGVMAGLTGVLIMAMYGILLMRRRAPWWYWIIPLAVLILFAGGAIAEFILFVRGS